MSDTLEIAKSATVAYNEKNWNKVQSLFSPEGVYDEKATHRRIQGVSKIIEAWQGWATAIPDSKATFVREIASGDTAILEVVWKGKHTGPLRTPAGVIAASQKPIEVPACQLIQVKEGKVASFTHYFDFLTLLRQIGAA
jgi:steroid delta-isomerase-like uncharacterized protein